MLLGTRPPDGITSNSAKHADVLRASANFIHEVYRARWPNAQRTSATLRHLVHESMQRGGRARTACWTAMAMMAITTTTATADGGGARLEIQVYFTWSTTGVYREP